MLSFSSSPSSLSPSRSRSPSRSSLPSRPARSSGFTLIEIVIVMAMLGFVLSVAYSLLLDCIEAERRIDKVTIPEKVGEGVLSLIRRDLSGTIYRNLGTRIFLGIDGGVPPDARDEIRFVSTVEPTPVEEGDSSTLAAGQSLRTLTGIAYFLRPSTMQENVSCFTLFRKEIVDFGQMSPLEAPGTSFEVYDKVKSFSIECFDGLTWYPDWDSEVRIRDEEAAAAALAQESEGGIGRVSTPANPLAQSAPGVDPNAASQEEVLPPAGIPVAVRIEVSIYAAIGNRFEKDSSGNLVVKTYSTIIPILAAQRIPIDIEDAETDAGGVASGEGEGGGEEMQGSAIPGGAGAGTMGFEKAGGPGGRGPGGRGPGGGGRGGAPGGRGGRAGPGGGPPGGQGGEGGAGRIAPRIGGGR